MEEVLTERRSASEISCMPHSCQAGPPLKPNKLSLKPRHQQPPERAAGCCGAAAHPQLARGRGSPADAREGDRGAEALLDHGIHGSCIWEEAKHASLSLAHLPRNRTC